MRRFIIAAILCLFVILWAGEAAGFGVNFRTDRTSRAAFEVCATAFETDVMIESKELEDPLSASWFFAWQSEMRDSQGKLPPIGGHWGFEMKRQPDNVTDRRQYCTFNFGWNYNAAVLPLGNKALIHSMLNWNDQRWVDSTERLKWEIERNIARNPKKPNLFLSSLGKPLPGQTEPGLQYLVTDWKLNQWYKVRLARDEKPSTVTAWVLRPGPDGVLRFGEQPESVSAYAWRVTLTPEDRLDDGAFRVNGPPIELAPFYLESKYDRLHTFTCWGETLGNTPKCPIRWCHVKPRVITPQGQVLPIPRAETVFGSFDQPENNAGPLGDSRRTHSFFIEYLGRTTVGDKTIRYMNRGMRQDGVLWDETAPASVSIEPEPMLLEWKESAVAAYLSKLPNAKYSADPTTYNGKPMYVNRTLILPTDANVRIEYRKLFGGAAPNLSFNAYTRTDTPNRKTVDGIQFAANAHKGQPFHVQFEVFDPNKSNTVGWMDLLIVPELPKRE